MILKASETRMFCVTPVLIVALCFIIEPFVTLGAESGTEAASEHEGASGKPPEKKHQILVDIFNEYKAGKEPPDLTEPTPVHVGLYVAEITAKTEENTFTMRATLTSSGRTNGSSDGSYERTSGAFHGQAAERWSATFGGRLDPLQRSWPEDHREPGVDRPS